MDKEFKKSLEKARKILWGRYDEVAQTMKKYKHYKGRTDKPYISQVLHGKIENLFVLDCANEVCMRVKKEELAKSKSKHSLFTNI